MGAKLFGSHLGFNLKLIDQHVGMGRVQLLRLPGCIEARQRHGLLLRRELEPLSHLVAFSLPTHATGVNPETGYFAWDGSGCRSDCSWFGFLLRAQPDGPCSRAELAQRLEAGAIGTRMLFGGNLLRQPAFVQLRRDRPEALRLASTMEGSDEIMTNTLFLGTYPGLTSDMLKAEIEVITSFAAKSFHAHRTA